MSGSEIHLMSGSEIRAGCKGCRDVLRLRY